MRIPLDHIPVYVSLWTYTLLDHFISSSISSTLLYWGSSNPHCTFPLNIIWPNDCPTPSQLFICRYSCSTYSNSYVETHPVTFNYSSWTLVRYEFSRSYDMFLALSSTQRFVLLFDQSSTVSVFTVLTWTPQEDNFLQIRVTLLQKYTTYASFSLVLLQRILDSVSRVSSPLLPCCFHSSHIDGSFSLLVVSEINSDPPSELIRLQMIPRHASSVISQNVNPLSPLQESCDSDHDVLSRLSTSSLCTICPVQICNCRSKCPSSFWHVSSISS